MLSMNTTPADSGIADPKTAATLADQLEQITQALTHSQERFHAVVEAASDAIVLANHRGEILSWNKAAQAMFHYTEEEVLGKPLTLIMPERYRAAHERGLQRVLATGRSTVIGKPVELSGLRKDGSEIPVELSLATWKSGDTTFFSGILRDITERKGDADRLAKINRCFLGFGKDPNDNINRLTALCGELLDGTWAAYSYLDGDLLHSIGRWRTPADFKAVQKPDGLICPEVIARGGNEVFVVQNLPETTYAKTVPYVVSQQLHTYVGQAVNCRGRSIGALCVFFQRDYTPAEADRRLLGIITSAIGVEEERKKAEQALRQAYDDTELILSSLPNAISIVNEDQVVVWANPLACRYFGGSYETILGRSLAEFLPPGVALRTRLILQLQPHSAEQGYWKQDRQFEARNHTYRYRCFPVAMRGSERPYTGLVMWDVTDEKRLQDQLVQAEKLASLGTMVSGMAHEINNPAQAILGMAELIMEEQAADTMKEYARDIIGYSKHIAGVVRDFASYARSSSRDAESDLDLNERLSEAVKMIRRGPNFGQVDVHQRFQPLPPLRARRTEIEQLFVNIISNAVQAMKGTGCLTLSTFLEPEKMVVSIADTGCGIPKATLKRIFDPFFTTKDPGSGTGLGLSIAYKIAAKYRGKINVQSEVGKGTTFTIEFPVVSPPQGGA